MNKCQGCGVADGADLVLAKATRRRNAVVQPAVLAEVSFADYGRRWFCQRCRARVDDAIDDLRERHVTMGS